MASLSMQRMVSRALACHLCLSADMPCDETLACAQAQQYIDISVPAAKKNHFINKTYNAIQYDRNLPTATLWLLVRDSTAPESTAEDRCTGSHFHSFRSKSPISHHQQARTHGGYGHIILVGKSRRVVCPLVTKCSSALCTVTYHVAVTMHVRDIRPCILDRAQINSFQTQLRARHDM
jgi:hypothetical protein